MRLNRLLPMLGVEIKKIIREPSALFIVLLFPVVLTLAFGSSFSGAGTSVSYSVGVVDLDHSAWSEGFQNELTATQILHLSHYQDLGAATPDLQQGRLSALLIIPSGFGASCQSYRDSPSNASSWVLANVSVYVDQGSIFASQAIGPVVSQTMTAYVAPDASAISMPVSLSQPQLVSGAKTTAFDVVAPGMFAFASIFLIMIVSGAFTASRDSGLLRRLNVTPITAGEFMSANVAAYMVLAAAQMALVFIVALAMGWTPSGGAQGVFLGVVLLLIFSACNVGFGLITATLAKSQSAATGLAFLFVLPQMFLGTFVGSMLGGTAAELGKFVPSYYVTDALTSVFVRGASVTSGAVVTDLLVVAVSSLVVLVAGVFLFQRYGSR